MKSERRVMSLKRLLRSTNEIGWEVVVVEMVPVVVVVVVVVVCVPLFVVSFPSVVPAPFFCLSRRFQIVVPCVSWKVLWR